jgi:hypothetical protein
MPLHSDFHKYVAEVICEIDFNAVSAIKVSPKSNLPVLRYSVEVCVVCLVVLESVTCGSLVTWMMTEVNCVNSEFHRGAWP